MIRRWNLTIILLVTAFVLGVVAEYVYRDRFSRLLVDRAELDRTEPDTAEDIFRAEIQDMLRPETGMEAVTSGSEVYAFTGHVQAIAPDRIAVNEPDGTIEFLLSEDTRYITYQAVIREDGLPDSVSTDITYEDIDIDDLVTVYTNEDIRTAPERHVHTVQKLINE